MGVLYGQADPIGLLVPVKVMPSPQRVAYLKSVGQTFPAPRVIRGLVDTGASCSAVDHTVVKALQLDPSGETQVVTPSTVGLPFSCYYYDLSIVLGDPGPTPRMYTLAVVETELADQGFHFLVGRDVLSRCVLRYDGPNGVFQLDF